MMYITLIELVDRDQHPLYCVERFIEGDYVKYNSNRGFVRSEEDNQSPTHELLVRQTPQAFSHFSWQESGGELIIVDIQGVGDLYTDPQIHTRTTADDASASANLGQRGMAYFFASHTCTGICSKLGLKPILTCPSDAATLSPKAPVQDPPELGATAEDPQPAKVVRQISEDPQSAKVVRQISARHLRHSTKAGAKKSAKSKSHNLRRLCTEAQRAPTGIISMQMAEDMRVQVAAIPAQPSPAGEIHLELAKMHCYGALADSPDQRDMVAALFHFQLAAQDGHSEAIWNLCKMYQGLPGMLEDLSVPEDPALAAALMARAAAGGAKQAMFMAARSESVAPEDRVKYYQQAIESGGGEFDWGNAVYQLKAGLAELLIADESSSWYDPMRSWELLSSAAEDAMDAGKMKLWQQYSERSEEAGALCPE
eukprot:TRINITY_DN8495_c0_g1_i1.p1 TRINITY_DN8495_c0_g1~~TRINITY_DN8495_c0_g1_i1.p1  ORF type:complete len:425 (+),score=111.44 TRINITY_DN8495_c0_g1_i1:205-1479(+)